MEKGWNSEVWNNLFEKIFMVLSARGKNCLNSIIIGVDLIFFPLLDLTLSGFYHEF